MTKVIRDTVVRAIPTQDGNWIITTQRGRQFSSSQEFRLGQHVVIDGDKARAA